MAGIGYAHQTCTCAIEKAMPNSFLCKRGLLMIELVVVEGKSDLCPNHQDERISIWFFLGVGGDRVKSIDNKRGTLTIFQLLCINALTTFDAKESKSSISRRKSQSHPYYYSNSYRFSSEENSTTFRVDCSSLQLNRTVVFPRTCMGFVNRKRCSWPEKKIYEILSTYSIALAFLSFDFDTTFPYYYAPLLLNYLTFLARHSQRSSRIINIPILNSP